MLMRWEEALRALSEMIPATGYTLMQLRKEDVGSLTEALRAWYPDIVVGSESCHLEPSFYHARAALADGDLALDILPIVAKHGDSLAAMITFERNTAARTITSRMGAAAPAHRGSGISMLGPTLLERFGRAMGAELAYYYATLKSRHQQVLAERNRYTLVGIVPAFDRDMVRPGEVRRVYEAIYAKVLVEGTNVEVPGADALTPRTRAVWDALFGQRNW